MRIHSIFMAFWALVFMVIQDSKFQLVVADAEETKTEPELNFKKMRIKDLKRFLNDRGLACKGCAEKEDFVKMAEENKDAPIVEKKESEAVKDAPPSGGSSASKDPDMAKLMEELKKAGLGGFQAFSREDLENGKFPSNMGNNEFNPEMFAKKFGKKEKSKNNNKNNNNNNNKKAERKSKSSKEEDSEKIEL